jgi:hypothetical protein
MNASEIGADRQHQQAEEDRCDLTTNAPRSHGQSSIILRQHGPFLLTTCQHNAQHGVAGDSGNQAESLDLTDPAVHENRQDEQGDADHDRYVDPNDLRLHAQRADDRGEPEDQENVGYVRTDDIAQRDVSRVAQGGSDADDHLRRTRAEGDDGQPDEE